MALAESSPELRAFIAKALEGSHLFVDAGVILPPGESIDGVAVGRAGVYVIEVKPGLATREAVAQLALYAQLYAKEHPGASIIPVLVARNATAGVRGLLDAIGGRLVEAPPALLPAPVRPDGQSPVTTEKAWRVFTTLLRLRVVANIRRLSEESGVSAGWVHKTVEELAARGLASKGRSGIEIADARKVLDIVPFERPFKELETAVIPTEYSSAHEAAVEITRLLARERPDAPSTPFAFCGHTAAGLHTGYAHRHDRVDLYATDPSLRALIEAPPSSASAASVRVHVFRADRDISRDAMLLDGARVVGRDVALLDMAGLGFSARDVAVRMLESYGDGNGA